MKVVFADSFHFLALLNDGERAHRRAILEHRRAWQRIVTTDCIILEVGDALCALKDRDDFLALLSSLEDDSRIKIVRLTPKLLERGIQLLRDRPDKNWPLTDCISFVVMADEGIKDALTGDKHYEQAGFNALLR
jgi:predicted nucleic acid-binding protein